MVAAILTIHANRRCMCCQLDNDNDDGDNGGGGDPACRADVCCGA
jgi:hypothetical protein